MPYRRLPNTDVARLKALEYADKKGSELPPFKLSYTQSTYNKVKSFLPTFKKAMLQHKVAYSNQVGKSKDYLNDLKKAKLYISHFIQVMNMSVQRGELPSATRMYYELDQDEKKTPPLNSEEDVILWGERIINGENNRVSKGLNPITNPTIAVVKVRYEKFLDSYRYQKTLQKTNSRSLKELSELRKQADEIILNVWNEVEDTMNELPDGMKREKCQEYGLVYVFRKNELQKLNITEDSKLNVSN